MQDKIIELLTIYLVKRDSLSEKERQIILKTLEMHNIQTEKDK